MLLKGAEMKYTHLFWDFNGTVFDDVEAGMVSTNIMLAERGLPVIDGEDAYREIFDFPIKEYYRRLGFDFSVEPYEYLAPLWVDIYNEKSKDAETVAGVRETLARVRELGIKQVIFSATETAMLTRQLTGLGIIDYFDEIIGLDNIHAESKLHLAAKWREANPEARLIYVGDTIHDAENAKVLEADCLLFAGGHQSRRRLEACGCPIIENIEELVQYLD